MGKFLKVVGTSLAILAPVSFLAILVANHINKEAFELFCETYGLICYGGPVLLLIGGGWLHDLGVDME